jgi:hypothetical protein
MSERGHTLQHDGSVGLDLEAGQRGRVKPSLPLAKLRVTDSELGGPDHST